MSSPPKPEQEIENFDPKRGEEFGCYEGVEFRVTKKGSGWWQVYAFHRLFTWDTTKRRAISMFKSIIDRGFE